MGLTANELSVLKRTGGSNPLASATQLNTSARSSTDRASDYGSEGWGFESLRARFGRANAMSPTSCTCEFRQAIDFVLARAAQTVVPGCDDEVMSSIASADAVSSRPDQRLEALFEELAELTGQRNAIDG